MIVLIVDMDWMGLQSFPNKALLNNDSIWVKHTGKKNWFNLQVTAFHRGQLERFLMSLQRKVKKAQSLSHLNSNASFKTAWQVNGKMHWHKHSQCEQSRWTERAVDVSYSYCDLPSCGYKEMSAKSSPTNRNSMFSLSSHVLFSHQMTSLMKARMNYDFYIATKRQLYHVERWCSYKRGLRETGGKQLWGEKGHTAVHWCPYKPYK